MVYYFCKGEKEKTPHNDIGDQVQCLLCGLTRYRPKKK